MIRIVRTTSADPAFRTLTAALDDELWARYPDIQGDHAPFNLTATDTAVIALAGTPLPSAICTPGGAADTASRPITVIAQHPRQAHLASNGTGAGFAVEGCVGWVLDGLYASSTDQPIGVGNSQCPITAVDSPGFIGRNLLVTHPNGCTNTHGICIGGTVTGSPGALVEDSEIYDVEHAGLFAADSADVTLRRNYVRGRLGAAPACATVDGHADRTDLGAMCFEFVSAPSCRFENLVVENVGDAFRGERATAFEVLGSIARNAYFGVLMQTAAPGAPPVEIDDLVCVDCDVGIWNRGVASIVRGATLVGGRPRIDVAYGRGAWADPGALSSVWERVVALDNTAAAFDLFTSYTVVTSVAAGSPLLFPPGEPFDDDAGNIQRSSTAVPTLVGDRDGACLADVPPGSSLAGAGAGGADIGASIVYRSVDGQPTQAKLWNQRTGAFPCGAIVPGVNDVPGASCRDLHERVRIGVAGCPIP